MTKGLDKATLITSCDTCQQADWFARYLTACQYPAEARGNAVYAVGMVPEQVSSFWAAFLGQGVQANLRNRRDALTNSESKMAWYGLELAIIQGEFLKTPSATNYSKQGQFSLKYQEAWQAAEEARAAYRHALSFSDLAEETKARLAREEHDQKVSRMAIAVWARERQEREANQAG
jgi:hypothetical protein